MDKPTRDSCPATPPADAGRGQLHAPASQASSTKIFVIDDEAHLRKIIARQLTAAGYDVETYPSAREFLKRPYFEGCGCILLDIQMPGMTGLELQEEMAKADYAMPIIFVTGCAELDTCVKAMKKGAEDFLTKPFDERTLLDAVALALAKDRENRRRHADMARAKKLLGTLTARELEVMRLLVTGRLNKQIAAELGIAEITVKVHRRQVLEKLGVTSLVDVVRLINCASGEA